MLEESIEQFQRIAVWDDEYQEAYFYEARSHAMLYKKNHKPKSLASSFRCLKTLKEKCSKDRYENSWKGWKEDIKQDNSFASVLGTEKVSSFLKEK